MTRGAGQPSRLDGRRGTGVAAVAAIVCAAALTLAARAPQSTAAAPETPVHVVLGCISRETPATNDGGTVTTDPVFTIADRRSDPPSIYRVVGDRERLDLHVGHTVELRGTFAPAPADSDGNRKPGWPTLTVESLVWISTRCLD